MRNPGLRLGADLNEAYAAMGAMTGVTEALKSNKFLSDVVKYAHSDIARTFDQQMHLKAGAMQERFNHVYEWGLAGTPGAHLWRHTLSGTGGQRTASFEFRASKKPIPTPEERAQNPRDPMSRVSEEDRERLSSRRYIFYWKAPMMEYRLQVTIAPRWSNVLFIPTFRSERGFVLSKRPVTQRAGTNLTAGAFTSEFVEWFSGPGQAMTTEKIREVTGMDAQAATAAGVRIKKSTRMGTVGLSSISDTAAAFEAGRQAAKSFMTRRALRRIDE